MSRRSLRDRFAGRDKRPLAISVAALLLAAAVPSLTPANADQPRAAATTAKPSFSETRTIDRTFVNADGSVTPVLSKDVTVTADQTRNLQPKQRILISWKGAQPSGGRASNPYGESGLAQEYPVVILQCRGTDDPTAPAAKRLSPSTCFTNSVAQRSQIARGAAESTWLADRYNTAADRQRLSGIDPFPSAQTCPGTDVAGSATHLTPFVAVGGSARTFPACNADQMPPESGVGAATPPAELAAFTDADGNGSAQFEVRGDKQNESLGCNDKVACSVVVIPILGLSCDKPSVPASTLDKACRRGGRFPAGSSNFAGDGVDQAVSPALWWSESNWRNRFTIPITFALPAGVCNVLDKRPPTGFWGSELLLQAGLQWAPAYCLSRSRFNFQLNQTSDVAGFNLMLNNAAAAAVVTSSGEPGETKVGYAPTAVTGFAVGFIIDRPDNAGELTSLRLNARLLAKLYTMSYPGSALGQGHPGMGDNPLGLMNDPEFQKLNPGLSTISQEAGATVLSLSVESDVIKQLTSYIVQDPDARAFLAGKPDPWGMKINPSYKGIDLPVDEWPLSDTYIPETNDPCRQKFGTSPYLNQIASPVPDLTAISEALLYAWPKVSTRCEIDQATGNLRSTRIDRQNVGTRFMLGIVSLGDAARYGLRTASLETRPGTYVAPSDESLAAALRLTRQRKQYGPFELDQADVRKSATAYPGTMVVYTAAKLSGALPADAKKVAQFIRVSTTEGQRPGTGNGELPGGFLPIVDSGATRPLFRSAQTVAKLVEEQKADPTTGGTDGTDGGSDGTGGTGATGGLPGGVPDGGTALPADGGLGAAPGDGAAAPAGDATAPAGGASAAPGGTTPVAMPATQAVGSRTAGGLLPTLLILGLVGIAVASGVRFFVQPTRPASPGAAGR